MKRTTLTGLFALCLVPATATAATLVLSGEQGYNTVQVRDADLYFADKTFRVLVEQTNPDANIGVLIRESPEGATWSGGAVVGMGVNRTESWDAIYLRLPGPGNGACFIAKRSERITVERLQCEWTWDGFRPEDYGVSDWRMRFVWFNNTRDDAVENDKCQKGRIEHSIMEDSFVGYSARPGSEGVLCEHTLEIVGSLLSLGRHYDDREKAVRPWSNRENGRVKQSGALFKVRDRGAGTQVLLRDSMIKLDHTPGVGTKELPIIPENWQIIQGSGNNTFVWLGENNLPGLTYEEIDGCTVPKEFKVPRNLFKVTCGANGQELWDTARTELMVKIDPSQLPAPDPDPIEEFLLDVLEQLENQRNTIEEFAKKHREPEG